MTTYVLQTTEGMGLRKVVSVGVPVGDYVTGGEGIDAIVKLTAAEYDALPEVFDTVMYVIIP